MINPCGREKCRSRFLNTIDPFDFLCYDLHAETVFSKTRIVSGSNMRPVLAHPASASVWDTPALISIKGPENRLIGAYLG